MKTAKSLRLATNILLHSRLRSWLTIVGIVIGVAAVVAIMSLGTGMEQELESRLGGLGADIITVSPGSSRAFGVFGGGRGMPGMDGFSGSANDAENLTIKDVQIIRSTDNVEVVYGSVSARGEVYYLGEKATVSITGVDPLMWSRVTTAELESGRFLNPSDYAMVVIGSRIAEDTFKQQLALNRNIIIEDRTFKIVGILQAGDDDNSIIMPIDAARDILDDVGQDEFDSITIKVADEGLVDDTMEDIDSRLMLSRHVTDRTKDYTITSSAAMQETVSETMSSMTLFLTAIAAVSLLVGAVGIANTMFTTVLEKTKEIGIMKAIGARNSDIMKIFLINSALVGLIGGIVGVFIGSIASSFLTLGGLGRMGGLSGFVTINLVVLGLLIAVGTALAAGVIPAYRASKLKPVDALRYE